MEIFCEILSITLTHYFKHKGQEMLLYCTKYLDKACAGYVCHWVTLVHAGSKNEETLPFDDATTTVPLVHGVTRMKEHVINLCS